MVLFLYAIRNWSFSSRFPTRIKQMQGFIGKNRAVTLLPRCYLSLHLCYNVTLLNKIGIIISQGLNDGKICLIIELPGGESYDFYKRGI